MFRRNRPFRRSRRPFRPLRGLGALFNPNGALAPEAREAFEEANELFDGGEYAEAAERFTELAELAQNFNRPRRAIQLQLRAYDAWLKARQPANALKQAQAVLNIVFTTGKLRAGLNIARQVIDELRAAGFKAEADILTKETNERLAAHGLSLASSAAPAPDAAPAPRPGKLPTACPQCSGRLPRSFGEDEIECDYCGSIIRAE